MGNTAAEILPSFKLWSESSELEGCVMLKMACMDLSSHSGSVTVPICFWTNPIGEHLLRAKVVISAERSWTFHIIKFNITGDAQ